MNTRYPFISVIIPTYREAENIEPLLSRLEPVLAALDRPYEIIVVDDDSRDGIEEKIEKAAAHGKPVRLILRSHERGLSTAVLRGFQEARGDILVCMDADLSHPPEAIVRMLAEFEQEDTQFVLGSRYVKGATTDEAWGLFRWINSRIATWMARPFTSTKDPMSGFFMLPKTIFERAEKLNPIGYKIGLELMVKCHCRDIREIPIHFADRKFGQSKLNLKEQWNYLRHVKRLLDFKLGNISYFTQFAMVGVSGLLIDLTLYTLLLALSLNMAWARGLAIWVAMSWNFALNRRMTFSYSRKSAWFPQYLKYTGSCTLGATVSWALAVFLPRWQPLFHQNLLLAALVGIAGGTLVNYTISRFWVFKKGPV